MATTSLYAQKAISRKEDIPNPKERGYWLAGGDLRNDTLAGGSLFDVQSIPAVFNMPRSGSAAVAFNAGTVLEYLNTGYTNVLNVLTGSGFLDLMNDYTVRSTAMLYYTLTITTTDGTIYTKTNLITSGSGRDGNTEGIQGSTATSSMDLATAQKAMNSQFNALGMVANQDIVSLGMGAFDLATGKISSVEVAIAGGLIGSVNNIAISQVTSAIASALGTTSIASVLGIGAVVSIVLGELMEMAMGLDNHFGFGGEFVGYNVNGERVYTKAKTLEEVWYKGLQSVGLAESSLSPGAPGSYNSGYGLSNDYNDGGAFGDNNLDNDETSDSLGSELGGMQTGPNGEEGMDPDNPGW